MTASTSTPGFDDLAAVLGRALSAGSSDALIALMTDDVRWGAEHTDDGACVNRDQVSVHYTGLLATGATFELADVRHVDTTAAGEVFVARIVVGAPGLDGLPPEVAVRLVVRDGLIADVRMLDPLDRVEVLHVDDCPAMTAFLPHLRDLLDQHGIHASITLTRIVTDEDAQRHQFLGSPTVRVNGVDVDPGVDPAVDSAEVDALGDGGFLTRYGLQCRLYRTGDGVSQTPRDEWIVNALTDDPIHAAAVSAIHTGDVPALRELLREHPDLATARLPRHQRRTLLHVATDWPGHYPNVADTIAALAVAGADPNARFIGEHAETPLHWAASSDDVAAIDALLDAGADINAPGAVIGGGTPMADATAFGQWRAARRLLERGSDTTLFEAAALGLAPAVRKHLDTTQPTPADITSALWGACHGGHISTAEVLLEHGADLNWVGYDDLTPLDAAQRADAADVVEWLRNRGAVSAT